MFTYREKKYEKGDLRDTGKTEITLTELAQTINASENVYIEVEEYPHNICDRMHIFTCPFSFHVDVDEIDLLECHIAKGGIRTYYLYQRNADFTLRFDCYSKPSQFSDDDMIELSSYDINDLEETENKR